MNRMTAAHLLSLRRKDLNMLLNEDNVQQKVELLQFYQRPAVEVDSYVGKSTIKDLKTEEAAGPLASHSIESYKEA